MKSEQIKQRFNIIGNSSKLERAIDVSLQVAPTDISILVDLKLNGVLKLIPFLKFLLLKRMNSVMSEFIVCAESYSKSI